MEKFGEKDTRFKGFQDMPEQPEQDEHAAETSKDVHFHNCTDLILNTRINLAHLCAHLKKKDQ